MSLRLRLSKVPVVGDLAARIDERRYYLLGDLTRWLMDQARIYGPISTRTGAARRFGSFGEGSIICFPHDSIVAERTVHIGDNVLIGPHISISGGWFPAEGAGDRVVVIGDNCLIGRGSSIIGHVSIEIGNDVWTGHNVHITDMNHDYVDVNRPCGAQNQEPAPVRVGDGSWIGHNVVILPGCTIGRHVVVGAGSVVTGDLPDFTVAVGSPARVIRRYDPTEGWVGAGPEAATIDPVLTA